MSLGLDTSVVLRLLVGEPAGLVRAARSRLERALDEGETVLVCDLVIAEAYFALHHHYGVPKAEARDLLAKLLDSGVVHAEPPESRLALQNRPGAGLVDRLVHARYRNRAAVTLTFERKQAALEGAQRLR